MGEVDHAELFARIARELPDELVDHVFVAGSLAAACHFAEQLGGRAVKTKDADLVVHPAGDALSASQIADHLLAKGWRRKDDCYASTEPEPADDLRAIRLYPPEHSDYFVELLNVPPLSETKTRAWIPVQLGDGWYGLPSFQFLALTAIERETSKSGLQYASPCMMAAANLLAHKEIGTARMSVAIERRSLLRSAKDLGRVLALAWLAGPDETETWLLRWRFALGECFPKTWRSLTENMGGGLRALLDDAIAFEEAWFSCDAGLLSGRGVTQEQLRGTARRLLLESIEPLEQEALTR